MEIIRFKLQYDHFLVHSSLFCTNNSNAKVYTLIIHGKKCTAHKAPNFRSEEKITKSDNTHTCYFEHGQCFGVLFQQRHKAFDIL